METESNETILYEGEDRDGDQIQIVGLKNGEVILRVRHVEDGITLGIYLDDEMMIDLIAALMATKVVITLFAPPKKEAVQ
jgi:hypothetical protein